MIGPALMYAGPEDGAVFAPLEGATEMPEHILSAVDPDSSRYVRLDAMPGWMTFLPARSMDTPRSTSGRTRMSSDCRPGRRATVDWCFEHQCSIDGAGRCEWDKGVEEYLDGPLPSRMTQEQVATAMSALRRDREWYERQIWHYTLQLSAIKQRMTQLARREAA